MQIRVQVGDFRLGEREKKAINEVLDSGRISEGKKVREFEQKFAQFIGTKHCVATSSGAGAMITGLSVLKFYDALNIKNGAKVITTPLTYIATSNSILMSGYEPVYVDVDRKRMVITPDSIKAHLESVDDTSNYKIILPVHLMGYAAEMDKINKIAKEYGMVTIEDSAQAHGTIYNGKKLGSWSLWADFSFYIAHNIQAGEMGAITTDDPEIARLSKKFKAQGRMCDCSVCTRMQGICPRMPKGEEDVDPRFTHDILGANFKPMEVQAALGLTQLEKAEWIIRKRVENVKYLNEGLAKFSDALDLPIFSNEVSYLAYPIVIKNPKKISRKRLRKELEDKGIETRPLFGSIPTQQPAYKEYRPQYEGKLPNAEYLGLNAFYIGIHQYLTQDDLDYVVKSFSEILR
jgi:dTDP-4-amino-4,6-dideoxygalactose transaminase